MNHRLPYRFKTPGRSGTHHTESHNRLPVRGQRRSESFLASAGILTFYCYFCNSSLHGLRNDAGAAALQAFCEHLNQYPLSAASEPARRSSDGRARVGDLLTPIRAARAPFRDGDTQRSARQCSVVSPNVKKPVTVLTQAPPPPAADGHPAMLLPPAPRQGIRTSPLH